MKSHFYNLRRRIALLCPPVALFALSGIVRADDVPTFSDPEVTAYAKAYGEFTDHYSANMKDCMAAVKSGDTAKVQAAAAKMQPDTAKAQEMATKSTTISSKVKPDEVQKFSGYLQKCALEMSDAAK